jgi:hypothetical protein
MVSNNEKGWLQIGRLAVDDGRLLITDFPQEAEVILSADRLEAEGNPDHLQLNFAHGGPGAGVVVSTGIKTGIFPVYARWELFPDTGRRVAEVKVVIVSPSE